MGVKSLRGGALGSKFLHGRLIPSAREKKLKVHSMFSFLFTLIFHDGDFVFTHM